MDPNNLGKKPIRASEEPIFPSGSGLARGLGAVGNLQQPNPSTSRPIGIGSHNPTSSTIPPPNPTSTVTRSSRPMGMAQSAPVATFVPPKPPSARPSVPTFEPPPFDLPPSLPNPSFLESHLANKIEEGVEEDDEEITNTTGAIGIQPINNDTSNTKKPVDKTNQWGGGMARSLTNNNPFYIAMSCPNVDYASNTTNNKQPTIAPQSDNKALDLGMGRSPTILSIMSGIEGQFPGAGTVLSAPNPSSRASITRVPPMSNASSRRFEAVPDEEDEDDDEVLDNNGDEDDELQFNFTLDANE